MGANHAGRLDFEDVRMQDFNILQTRQVLLQDRQQSVINLDCHHACARLGQGKGERADARPYFEHGVAWPNLRRLDNLVEDVGVAKEVLPKPLAKPQPVLFEQRPQLRW
jgi:hypothetical protein